MAEETIVMGMKLMENKAPEELEVGEGTYPPQGGRFRGVSIGRNKIGYFCFTHRATSREYNSPKDIPDGTIEFIRTTG